MTRTALAALALVLGFSGLVACGGDEPVAVSSYKGPMQDGSIAVTSAAFAPGGKIPRLHAHGGEGDNASPPLSWSGVPEAAKEVAIVVDDPDAPGSKPFVHWIVYRIPASTTSIPARFSEGARALEAANGPLQGTNDFPEQGWGGPLPPKKSGVHHYRFWVHALDAPLKLAGGATYAQLVAAMKGHVLAQGFVVGTYER